MRSTSILLAAAAAVTVSGGFVETNGMLASVAYAQGYADDAAIRRAFASVLRRDPTPREMRRYRMLMDEYGWREADVRADLRDRTDYTRYTTRGARPDTAIRRAYHDILGRDPDAEGLAHYRRRMIDEGWTEQDVREALRRSDEYGSADRRTASADRIIRRAYNDILRREPDPEGLANYRRQILEEGWEEHDVRRALRRSTERRELRRAVSDAQATDMVRRAYLSVLGREPDPEGLASYKAKVMRDNWSEAQLVSALRASPEYRNRQ